METEKTLNKLGHSNLIALINLDCSAPKHKCSYLSYFLQQSTIKPHATQEEQSFQPELPRKKKNLE